MKTTTTTIYQEMLRVGADMDSHASDLYVRVNDETKTVIAGYKHKSNVETFRSSIDGGLFYDIPFAYDPFYGKILD